MSPMEGLARQVEWCGNNIAHNLQFIPEDKLNWKPAPTAKSVLEIINHVAWFVTAMAPVVRGAEWAPPELAPAINREEAQAVIGACATAYAEALRSIGPESLARQVNLPFGTFPLPQAASMPAVDLVHHHGQIAYIQTLLGDTEDHFSGMD